MEVAATEVAATEAATEARALRAAERRAMEVAEEESRQRALWHDVDLGAALGEILARHFGEQ